MSWSRLNWSGPLKILLLPFRRFLVHPCYKFLFLLEWEICESSNRGREAVVFLCVGQIQSSFFKGGPIVNMCCINARAFGGGAIPGDVALFFAVEALSSEWAVRASYISLGSLTGSGVPATIHSVAVNAHVHGYWCVIKVSWGIRKVVLLGSETPLIHGFLLVSILPLGLALVSLSLTMPILLRSVTTKGNHLSSHGHKGERPVGKEPYKILYPRGGHPTPSGCTAIDQSEERDPSNITLYG